MKIKNTVKKGFTLIELIIVLAIFSMALVVFRHRANIKRLLAGTEPDFKAHKKEKAE